MAYLIDTVTLSQFGDIRRIADGTAIEPCHAVYEESVPLCSKAATASNGRVWTVDEFGDGSRRIHVAGPAHPLDGYPVHKWEYLEDIEGVPAEVLDALDQTVIFRVRGSAAERVRAFLHCRGGDHIAPAVRVTYVNGLPFANIYADGSTLIDGIPSRRWRIALYVHRDKFADLVVSEVAPGHEDLGRVVRRFLDCHAAAVRKRGGKAF